MKTGLITEKAFILALLIVTGALSLQFGGWCTEAAAEESDTPAAVPVKGMVTMVDLGAKACIPCKMMIPVMENVERKYSGKAAIIFIDVWKNKEPATRFGIRAIPTQIFFDKEGREIYRHIGFLSEEAIDSQLQKMGVN